MIAIDNLLLVSSGAATCAIDLGSHQTLWCTGSGGTQDGESLIHTLTPTRAPALPVMPRLDRRPILL